MLRILIIIALLLGNLSLSGDELEDKLREQEQIRRQLESAQQRVRQTEQQQRQTTSEIQRTSSLKRVTDNRLTQLRSQDRVISDSLRSIGERLNQVTSRISYLEASINDQMQMLLRVDRSYRAQGLRHRDHRFLSEMISQSKTENDVARGIQSVLSEVESQTRSERSHVQSTMRQTSTESRNYTRRISNLQGQSARLTREQQELQRRIETLQRDARELENLISRLRSAGPDEQIVDRFGSGELAWPVRGRIIRSFGQETRDYNTSVVSNGIDIAVPENTSVHAAEAGTVIFADRYGGQGKMVIIDHKNGFYTVYGYCNDLLVSVGTEVTRAQAIARSGRTGSASEPSLHFEVRRDGRAVNPVTYLQ